MINQEWPSLDITPNKLAIQMSFRGIKRITSNSRQAAEKRKSEKQTNTEQKQKYPVWVQKKYADLEAKKSLHNSYMDKLREKSREEPIEEPEEDKSSECIFCGKKHSTEDDLCPKCRSENPMFEVS